MAVTLYVKEGCPFCKALKDDLDKKGVEYEEIDVVKNPESQVKVLELAKKEVVPVMVEDGKVTIGFEGT